MKAQLPQGELVFVRPDRRIDAVGVEQGYRQKICDAFFIADQVSKMFAEQEDVTSSGWKFDEVADFVLYFRSAELGISVHLEDPVVEDGPFSEEDWQKVLRGHIAAIIVARHDDKIFAY